MVSVVSIIGLNKIGLVKPHDDISKLIVEAAKAEEIEFSDYDVVVVSQKIVSKSEGQLIDILTIKPSNQAKSIAKRTKKDARVIELILRDSKEVIRADREALVVRKKDRSSALTFSAPDMLAVITAIAMMPGTKNSMKRYFLSSMDFSANRMNGSVPDIFWFNSATMASRICIFLVTEVELGS